MDCLLLRLLDNRDMVRNIMINILSKKCNDSIGRQDIHWVYAEFFLMQNSKLCTDASVSFDDVLALVLVHTCARKIVFVQAQRTGRERSTICEQAFRKMLQEQVRPCVAINPAKLCSLIIWFYSTLINRYFFRLLILIKSLITKKTEV